MKPDAPEIPVDLADPFLVDFHRQVAVRSAAPPTEPAREKRSAGDLTYFVDREPEKRNIPPTPPPESPKVEPVDSRAFPPEAVETWQRAQQLAIDVQGVFNVKAFIGKSADGRTPPGALPWWWCYGRQPVHVKGAVYADSNEARHLVRGITEAEANRRRLRELGLTLPMTPRLAREKARRR